MQMQTTESTPETLELIHIVRRLMTFNENKRVSTRRHNGELAAEFYRETSPVGYGMEFCNVSVTCGLWDESLRAIAVLADRPDDLVIIKDRHHKEIIDKMLEEFCHRPVVIGMSRRFEDELRANPENLRGVPMADRVPLSPDPAWCPRRIFVFQSHYFYNNSADARSIIRWCHGRYNEIPLLVGL